MTTPQSPDTRPTDLETPGDINLSNSSVKASTDASTDTEILREQAVSASHARDNLQAKQDTEEDRLTAEGEETSFDIQQGAAIHIPGER